MKPLIVASLTLAMGVVPGSAHSIPTHKNITKAAVDYIRNILKLPDFVCAAGLESQLQIGTEHEDDYPRFMWHFSPRLNAGIYFGSCSSPQWGLVDGLNCAGTFAPTSAGSILPTPLFFRSNLLTYPTAQRNATNPSAATRPPGTPSTVGWNQLGYVLHLLEDLSSPAHTRNDPHPLWDPIEKSCHGCWAASDAVRTPGTPSGSLLSRSSVDAFFSELQAWTQARFFSYDTVFDSALAGPSNDPSKETDFYYYDSTGRKIAKKGLRYWSSCDDTLSFCNQKAAEVSVDIADEQWSEIGPKVVHYAASLIKHYYDTEKPALNIVRNGSFESGDLTEWTVAATGGCDFPGYAGPAGPYTTVVSGNTREGRWSARLGRWDQPYRNGPSGQAVQGAEPCGYSEIFQDVTLPNIADVPSGKLWLSFEYNVQTYDATEWDWFDAQIRNTGGTVLKSLVSKAGKPGTQFGTYFDDGWRSVRVDVSSYAGQTLRLWFGNQQDGYGDQNATWIDKVVICDQ